MLQADLLHEDTLLHKDILHHQETLLSQTIRGIDLENLFDTNFHLLDMVGRRIPWSLSGLEVVLTNPHELLDQFPNQLFHMPTLCHSAQRLTLPQEHTLLQGEILL